MKVFIFCIFTLLLLLARGVQQLDPKIAQKLIKQQQKQRQFFGKGEKSKTSNTINDYSELDYSTRSNYFQVFIQEQTFSLELDFEKEEITGKTSIRFDAMDEEPLEHIYLDIWRIEIQKVVFRPLEGEGDPKELKKDDEYSVDLGADNAIGGRLSIRTDELGEGKTPIKYTTQFFIDIEYVVPKKQLGQRSGYFFVQKEQTFDQTHPIFYTQNEPIYLRTWLPTQDSPSVRYKWKAEITAPQDLKVFMSGVSAENTQKQNDGTTTWQFSSFERATPGYFIGLVVGKLEEIDLFPDTPNVDYHIGAIYESSIQDKVEALGLQGMDSLIKYAEQYLDMDYMWNAFHMVIMPPNYPFEGAAHPGLTYISPSILNSGIKGHDLVMGQVAASFFGNGITCSTWSNVWMNYGFQRFLERKMMASFDQGINYPKLDRVIGNFTMIETMKGLPLGIEDTFASLEPDILDDVNPDDVLTEVQYEKGYQFLEYLEEITNAVIMKRFLSQWMQNMADRSLNWQLLKVDFLTFLEGYPEYLEDGENVDWNAWMYTPGLPPKDTISHFTSSYFDEVETLADKFLQFEGTSIPMGFEVVETSWKKEKPDMVYAFIDYFRREKYYMNRKIAHVLNQKFDFADDTDMNQQFRWFIVCIENRYKEADNWYKMRDFLGSTGRDSFIIPMYEALLQAGEDEVAEEEFQNNVEKYNPYTVHQIMELLGIEPNSLNKKVKTAKKEEL